MRYDASSITVLTGLQAVRQRPAMYIGSTGEQGVHHLVQEVVQNAVDETLAGYCTHIEVTVHPDGACTVEDDGRGIPVDLHPSTGRPAAEVVLTTLHAGGKFSQGAYGVAGGLHGVGLAAVNALSETLELEVRRGGRRWAQRYTRGEPEGPLEDLGPAEGSGTRLTFRPDPAVFGAAAGALSAETLDRRLEEQAFLHPGVRIHFRHQRAGLERTHAYEGGLVGFVEHLNAQRHPVHPAPIHVLGEVDGVRVEAALQWTTAYAEDLRAYVNSIFTSQGGSHVEGLRAAITRAVNRYAHHHALLDARTGEQIAGFDVREGLCCVLSVQMADPEFEGQTKSSLTSTAVTEVVERVVLARLEAWMEANPHQASAVVGKAVEASRARAAARRASERARYHDPASIVSKEVYRAQFGIRSRNWHESARWITDQTLLGAHAELCTVAPDARVLDVCCGSGVVGNSFRGRVGHITGLDLTPAMIELAKTRLDHVDRGDVYDLPYAEGTFDLVCNREVLHLLPRPEQPVSEIFRVLKPGGQFIVGQLVPFGPVDAPWMFRILKKKQPLFFNNFLEEDFRALLEGAGFVVDRVVEVLQWEDIDTWIDTHETPNLYRHEIRRLYAEAPAAVRAVHPFEITPSGAIRDCWRWCVFSAMKPE